MSSQLPPSDEREGAGAGAGAGAGVTETLSGATIGGGGFTGVLSSSRLRKGGTLWRDDGRARNSNHLLLVLKDCSHLWERSSSSLKSPLWSFGLFSLSVFFFLF